MKRNFKIYIVGLLLIMLYIGAISVLAEDDTFNAAEAFSEYEGYDDSQVNLSYKRYYVVTKEKGDNKKALFSQNEQLTDFIYNNFEINSCAVIAEQIIGGEELFGLLNIETYDEILPIYYTSLENYEVLGYIGEKPDGGYEYFIIKSDSLENFSGDIAYTERESFYIIENAEDFYAVLDSGRYENNEKTPIEGLEGCYIVDDGTTNGVNIVDENGNLLIDIDFRDVDTSLGEYDTLKVWYKEGMNDLSAGLLDKELNIIVPQNFYSQITFTETDGVVYAEALSYITGETDRYIVTETSDITYSAWAEESINSAIELGLVPDELMSGYTAKITRAEFCRLAVKTYTAKTGESVDLTETSSFADTDDPYITFAYKLKIVSGVGNNLFAPDNNITRQEAAVMLNNLADVLNIEKGEARTEAFADESYFADWAKAAIYTVAGIKSGDTYVMAGTGKDDNGKDMFSPLTNYTREQAIATMLRLYSCESGEAEAVKLSGDEYHYIGCGVYLFDDDSGKTGAVNSKGEIIVEPEYDRIVSKSRIFALNNIFTLTDDNNNFYIFDTEGNLKKTIHYGQAERKADGGKDAEFWVYYISGSNLVIREYVGDNINDTTNPEWVCFIKRLFRDDTAGFGYYDTFAVENGCFIAKSRETDRKCVLDANGDFVFEADVRILEYIEDGLYYGYNISENQIDYNVIEEYAYITIFDSQGNVLVENIKEEYNGSFNIDDFTEINQADKTLTYKSENNFFKVTY